MLLHRASFMNTFYGIAHGVSKGKQYRR